MPSTPSNATRPASKKRREPLPAWLSGEGQLVILKGMLIHAEEAESLGTHPMRLEALADLTRQQTQAVTRWQRRAIGDWGLPSPTAQPAALLFFETVLSELLSEASSARNPIAWAALSAWADGLDPQAEETWLTLWPGRLQFSPSQVGLDFLPTDANLLEAAEEQLAEACKARLGPETQLVRGRSGQRYLRAARALDLRTAHPSLVAGRHLPAFEPEGESAGLWRRLAHEVQMEWHALYQSRTGEPIALPAGRQAADLLWCWGAGSLSANWVDALGRQQRNQSMPMQSMPVQSVPMQSVPEQSMPGHLLDEQPALTGLVAALQGLGFSPRISVLDPRLDEADRPAEVWWQTLRSAFNPDQGDSETPRRRAHPTLLAIEGGFGWLLGPDTAQGPGLKPTNLLHEIGDIAQAIRSHLGGQSSADQSAMNLLHLLTLPDDQTEPLL